MSAPQTIKIQSALAIASFTAGVVLACICLFLIEPYGEIHTSAISIVSELLVLAGALLGINVNFDMKMAKFQSEMKEKYGNRDEYDSTGE